MQITYDPAKNERNINLRDLSFDEAIRFDFSTAVVVLDNRRDYGEIRWRALGLMEWRVYSLVFTETDSGIRVISFRKANRREVMQYEKATRS
jgi:uncharacterized DUF497 family protein